MKVLVFTGLTSVAPWPRLLRTMGTFTGRASRATPRCLLSESAPLRNGCSDGWLVQRSLWDLNWRAGHGPGLPSLCLNARPLGSSVVWDSLGGGGEDAVLG